MRRFLAALVAALGLTAVLAPSLGAQESAPPAKAWILVDADTGDVLDRSNAREPVRVASTIKLLTALIAVQRLDANATVPVSARAAAMPARKLNMGAGQEWALADTVHALLLSSANDAAAALAERVGGTMEEFATEMTAAGAALGLRDDPVLQDPSGLDDESSIGGGNVVSARDLAIIARAALADPTVAGIVATNEYSFTSPDGVGHRLLNHNKLLRTYQGAIGMKTGYTSKSGHTLIAAAERGDRRLIAVVLGANDMYGAVSTLLDGGFAMDPRNNTGDRLPPVRRLTVVRAAADADVPAALPASAEPGEQAAAAGAGGGFSLVAFAGDSVLKLLAGVVATTLMLRLRVLARNAQRRRQQARALSVLRAGQSRVYTGGAADVRAPVRNDARDRVRVLSGPLPPAS